MKKFILTIPGILLSVFGGGMFICCLFGAIEDEFQPVHVYLSLFFSFGVILALGIVMIYFGHKKNVKSKEGADYNYTPVQTPDKKTVKILLQELQKRTSQDSIKIQIEENRKPTLFGSKIGGIPYWDKKREYPKDSDGSKLMLLAQMNLNEIPENQMLPRTGILHMIAEELGVELDSRLEFYQMFDEYDKKYVDIHESTYGHRMFGYPHFRQWDPRGVEAADYYDTLLFQLDSDYWKNQWRILWGDAGVGAFFINSKKLEELDFGDVLYSWDLSLIHI